MLLTVDRSRVCFLFCVQLDLHPLSIPVCGRCWFRVFCIHSDACRPVSRLRGLDTICCVGGVVRFCAPPWRGRLKTVVHVWQQGSDCVAWLLCSYNSLQVVGKQLFSRWFSVRLCRVLEEGGEREDTGIICCFA